MSVGTLSLCYQWRIQHRAQGARAPPFFCRVALRVKFRARMRCNGVYGMQSVPPPLLLISESATGYRSYSLSRTLSYCSAAFDCNIRIYLFPNLSFAALLQVEYSSYESLVWYTRVFYLVVLIEHIVDWNIQTRLSGERPRIHGVRLSVAYSTDSLCSPK